MTTATIKQILELRYDELTETERLNLMEGAVDILLTTKGVGNQKLKIQEKWSAVQNEAAHRRKIRRLVENKHDSALGDNPEAKGPWRK